MNSFLTRTKTHFHSFFHSVLGFFRYSPLRIVLAGMGIFLLLFAVQVHGLSYVNVIPSTTSLSLQSGTQLPLDLFLQISGSSPITVSFAIDAPIGITMDGELNPLSTYQSITRHAIVKASPQLPPGSYPLRIIVRFSSGETNYSIPVSITVNVTPYTRVQYSTTSNSNVFPRIFNSIISPQEIELTRNETKLVEVSFVNTGSATDYSIEFIENPIEINARIQNPVHSFVQPGQTVQSMIEITARTNSPFGIFPISIRARNRVTNEKFYLGTISVNVKKVSNALLTLPFTRVQVIPNGTLQMDLTITNTEFWDLDLLLYSFSQYVVLPQTQVNILPNSSITIPIQVKGRTENGVFAETIYAYNKDITKTISFQSITYSSPSITIDENVSQFNGIIGGIGTGLVSGASASILGIIIAFIVLLLVFSQPARARVGKVVEKILGEKEKVEVKEEIVEPWDKKEETPSHAPRKEK